jgi:hypothetical protein
MSASDPRLNNPDIDIRQQQKDADIRLPHSDEYPNWLRFYHSTFSDKAPHEYGGTFHVGTLRAAWDRLDESTEQGGIVRYHQYAIHRDAPLSKKLWEDPIHPNKAKRVPEDKTSRIHAYTNEVEDPGSRSYVIPSNFVGTHVKHLGPQFNEGQELRGPGGQVIANAISTMVGGPFKEVK